MRAPTLEAITKALRAGTTKPYEPSEEDARLVAELGESDVEGVDLEVFCKSTFHLPGQHDQQSHAGGGLTPRDEVQEIPDAKLNAAVKDVSNWSSPAARRIGQAALRRYELSRDEDAELMVHWSGDGHALGVMTLGDSADLLGETGTRKIKARDYLEVEYLASGQKGAGSALLAKAFERAAETGRGVVLYSLQEARKFYEAMGGTELPDAYSVYFWTPSKVASMVERPEPVGPPARTAADVVRDLVAEGRVPTTPLKD